MTPFSLIKEKRDIKMDEDEPKIANSENTKSQFRVPSKKTNYVIFMRFVCFLMFLI